MNKQTTEDYKKVYDFLKKHPMGVLSTSGSDETTWGAAIYYIADEDLNLYFVTRTGTLKYKNLEERPFAALTVVDAENQITVQLSGKVEKMPINKYMDVFFDKFAAMRPDGDYHWAPPVDKVHEGNYMPLQLTPTHLQYADYGKRRPELHGNYIDQIIPS
ncbi:MAG: pyridoxamine 5'-phosphate oxidase family protein [Patescibacteria group bacterium]|nr:pyridoxamine 5'-phosphate oxidase family protein [Patescibacteria group bacterium]